jgi:hypothetical protein
LPDINRIAAKYQLEIVGPCLTLSNGFCNAVHGLLRFGFGPDLLRNAEAGPDDRAVFRVADQLEVLLARSLLLEQGLELAERIAAAGSIGRCFGARRRAPVVAATARGFCVEAFAL